MVRPARVSLVYSSLDQYAIGSAPCVATSCPLPLKSIAWNILVAILQPYIGIEKGLVPKRMCQESQGSDVLRVYLQERVAVVERRFKKTGWDVCEERHVKVRDKSRRLKRTTYIERCCQRHSKDLVEIRNLSTRSPVCSCALVTWQTRNPRCGSSSRSGRTCTAAFSMQTIRTQVISLVS